MKTLKLPPWLKFALIFAAIDIILILIIVLPFYLICLQGDTKTCPTAANNFLITQLPAFPFALILVIIPGGLDAFLDLPTPLPQIAMLLASLVSYSLLGLLISYIIDRIKNPRQKKKSRKEPSH